MVKISKCFYGALFLALFVLPYSACRRNAAVRQPSIAPKVLEYLATGDKALAEHHLYAWRSAYAEYLKAYEIGHTEEARHKLLLTKFLTMSRQMDEDIPQGRVSETVSEICSVKINSSFQGLCQLARLYERGYGATSQGKNTNLPQAAATPFFAFDGGPLDSYLQRLYIRTCGLEEARDSLQNLPDANRNSAGNLYLDMGRETIRKAAELERMHPEFAELFAFLGEDQFQKTRYTGARNYFNKALQLVPDYTRAQIGLGNICFYALEDWAKAMQIYESVLRWDPGNTAALFGKGACLYHLSRHEESNDVMDLALKSDITRKGRASRQSIRYYQVEANYYKASNYSQIGDKAMARQFIEAARVFSRDTEHVNYLSAVLHFEGKQMEEAREELEQLIRSGTSFCNSRYYLGRIYHGKNDSRAFDQFLGACSCMQGTIRGMEKQLKSVPGMDIEAEEKQALTGRLEEKLFNYRLESSATVSNMINIVAASDHEKRKYYYDIMAELLSAIQPKANP